MAFSLDTAVLAVDGGGTRSRMAVESGGQRIEVRAGPTNVSTDAEGAIRTLGIALTRLAAAVDTKPDRLAVLPAHLGIAGILGPEHAKEIAERLPFRNARIEDDRRAAVEGALGPGAEGAVAHCGTGSFLGVRGPGGIRLAGGWGSRLGDEASATWLARSALSATLDAFDGLMPGSPLCDSLSEKLGGSRGIVGFARDAMPEAWGKIAPLVTGAAMDGDPIGRRIMKEGAEYISRALATLGWRPGDRLCLTGGVGPHFAHYLPKSARTSLADPAGTPLDGALALARARFEGTAP